ncbi:MAG: RluA family pseudouridine synthase [Verrucomicrobiales bacterium]
MKKRDGDELQEYPPGRPEVLEENGDFLVINKPPGWLVHPKDPERHRRTLWHWLHEVYAFEQANGARFSIINRLDRETSGLMLVALNREAAAELSRLLQDQGLKKEYMALALGHPSWQELVVDQPIARLAEHSSQLIWVKHGVLPQGQSARTRFVCEQLYEGEQWPGGKGALLRVYPETGRTHQIRVHAAWCGLPLLGDKLYGANQQCYLDFAAGGWSLDLQVALGHPRHALHACGLGMLWNSTFREWQLPLPPDLQEFVGKQETELSQIPEFKNEGAEVSCRKRLG